MSPTGALVAALGAAPAARAVEDIHDIRGPIAIPSVWPTLLLAGAGLAAAALLAAFFYALVRRWRRRRLKSPAQSALERLAAARTRAREGHAAELGAVISDTARSYVEARFDLRAPTLTTEEFLHDLASAHASPIAPHREELAAFLGACDLAKFARFAIDVEHQLAMVDAAVAFVRATDAVPKAPEHATASSTAIPSDAEEATA